MPDEQQQQPPQAVSSEQAADLAALQAAVNAAEGAQPGAATAVVPVKPVVDDGDVFNILQMVRDMSAPALEEMGVLPVGKVEGIWSNDVLKKIAQPLAEIMRRHDLGIDEAMDRFGPYLMLIAGLWGPSMATWRAMQAHAAEAAKTASTPAEEGVT